VPARQKIRTTSACEVIDQNRAGGRPRRPAGTTVLIFDQYLIGCRPKEEMKWQRIKKTTTETLHYEEEFMRHLNLSGMAVCIFWLRRFAGCASGQAFNQSSAPSKSAIRAAEEVGAGKLPSAALHLQLGNR
jgi:hypothetical protein